MAYHNIEHQLRSCISGRYRRGWTAGGAVVRIYGDKQRGWYDVYYGFSDANKAHVCGQYIGTYATLREVSELLERTKAVNA